MTNVASLVQLIARHLEALKRARDLRKGNRSDWTTRVLRSGDFSPPDGGFEMTGLF